MPLTLDFFETIKVLDKNWSMGVESVSPLIYALIRLTRPKRVLEIGAGYSSLFILQALADNLEDYKKNKQLMQGQARVDQHTGLRRLVRGRGFLRRHPVPLALPEFYESDYDPKLSVIDNRSHSSTSAGHVENVARKLKLSHLLQFQDGDFRGMSKKLAPELLPFDFAWFDCGAFKEYSDFIAEYWHLINPHNGLLVLHSTLTNLQIRYIIQGLKLKQATDLFNNFEMLSLLEPHKWRQNSVTIIRMLSADAEKIYTFGP